MALHDLLFNHEGIVDTEFVQSHIHFLKVPVEEGSHESVILLLLVSLSVFLNNDASCQVLQDV